MSAGDHLPAHPGAKCNPGQKVSSSFKARFTPLRPAFPCWGTGLRLGSQLLAEVLCPGPTSMCIRHTLFPLLLFLEFPWPRFGLGWPQGLAPSAQFPRILPQTFERRPGTQPPSRPFRACPRGSEPRPRLPPPSPFRSSSAWPLVLQAWQALGRGTKGALDDFSIAGPCHL